MKLTYSTLVATVLLAGCATSPKDIAAAYVSPIPYQNMTCTQLAEEAGRVSQAASVATGQQARQQNNDALAVTAAVVIFWPAVFFVGGDKTNAAEIARLKGEMNAIVEVNRAKNCGIRFQT